MTSLQSFLDAIQNRLASVAGLLRANIPQTAVASPKMITTDPETQPFLTFDVEGEQGQYQSWFTGDLRQGVQMNEDFVYSSTLPNLIEQWDLPAFYMVGQPGMFAIGVRTVYANVNYNDETGMLDFGLRMVVIRTRPYSIEVWPVKVGEMRTMLLDRGDLVLYFTPTVSIEFGGGDFVFSRLNRVVIPGYIPQPFLLSLGAAPSLGVASTAPTPSTQSARMDQFKSRLGLRA